MKKKKILAIVGARPNYMKVAPIMKAANKFKNIKMKLVHTGQHYDVNMSSDFFKDLKLPKPDHFLKVGSCSHAQQTALIMQRFEKVVLGEKPDMVLVVGDVNSTIACALVASKLGVKIAHVESGLRSFDRTMPEEINRILTDSISDLLFTTSLTANINLAKEGIDKKKIFFVGNVMIDTLLNSVQALSKQGKRGLVIKDKKIGSFIRNDEYSLLTLHRPSSVDSRKMLSDLVGGINELSKSIKVIFPVHPRTEKMLKKYDLKKAFSKNVLLTAPVSYMGFLKLMLGAKFVMTDSGGLQEETTVLDIPCITIRKNTERPITLSKGTNTLVGLTPKKLLAESKKILNGKVKKAKKIKYWDGKASERIVKILSRSL